MLGSSLATFCAAAGAAGDGGTHVASGDGGTHVASGDETALRSHRIRDLGGCTAEPSESKRLLKYALCSACNFT